jgi:DNA-binding NtrC family response regulator
MPSNTQRVLLVEDDMLFARALMRMMHTLRLEVTHVSTVNDALNALAQDWHAVIMDVRLPDGSGLRVADVAVQKRPVPLLIAISGQANRKDTFELGRLGVSRFLEKPVALRDLAEALRPDPDQPARALGLHAAQTVGHAKVHEVTAHVRQVMFEQALAMTKGNPKAAGELLGVSRQAVSKARSEGLPDGEDE